MRNLLLISILLLFPFSFGLSQQRLVLVEHFTGASCTPCATTNPVVDPVYKRNLNKIVVIKYQTQITDGVDPMYFFDPYDVTTRANYYLSVGGNYVPKGIINGGNNNLWFLSKQASTVVTDANFNAASMIPSNWKIDLSYDFNENYGYVTVTMKVTSLKSQIVAGPLKAHIVLIEKEVNYATAPGNNGEKDFLFVMRKMLPDALGTTLKSNWAEGEFMTITQTAPTPYYYNKIARLAVAAFIQDDSDRDVKQAAYAELKPIDSSIDQPHFLYLNEGLSLPIYESFETDTLPTYLPYSRMVNNAINNALFNPLRSSGSLPLGADNSIGALISRSYYIGSGVVNQYYLPTMDFRVEKDPILTFSHCYHNRTDKTTSFDSLQVQVSTDRGTTWTEVWKKGGLGLNSYQTATLTTECLPRSTDMWAQDTVNLSAFIGNKAVNVRFGFISKNNNTISVDQIRIEAKSSTGIAENTFQVNNIRLFQSGKGKLQVNFEISSLSPITFGLYQLTGTRVFSETWYNAPAGSVMKDMDISSLQPGVYIFRMEGSDQSYSQKIVIR